MDECNDSKLTRGRHKIYQSSQGEVAGDSGLARLGHFWEIEFCEVIVSVVDQEFLVHVNVLCCPNKQSGSVSQARHVLPRLACLVVILAIAVILQKSK